MLALAAFMNAFPLCFRLWQASVGKSAKRKKHTLKQLADTVAAMNSIRKFSGQKLKKGFKAWR